MADERQITTVLVEADVDAADVQRRVSSILVEADVDAADMQRRVSAIVLEVDVLEGEAPTATPRFWSVIVG